MPPLEFTLNSHDEDALAVLRPALENFCKTRRITPIDFAEISWDDAWNSLVRVALYRDGADVSEVGSTWVSSFVGMEALRAYTPPEIYKIGGAAAFLPSVWHSGFLIGDDRLWAVPWLCDTRVIFYWRDMLEHAGIDEATAFQSFGQMEQTLARLQASGVPTPWAVVTRHTAETLYSLTSWIWGAGGDFMSEDGRQILLAEPEARAGIVRYFNLYRYMPQHSETLDGDAIFKLFQQHGIAATISGSWFLKWLRQHGLSADTLSRIGVAPLPGPSFVGSTELVIWKHVSYDQERLAVDLVHFLATNPALLDFYHHAGLLPARRDLLAQPPFSTDPHYQKIIEALATGRTHSRISMWGLIEDRLTALLASLWSEVRADPAQDIAALVERNIIPLVQRLTATLAGRH
jgi:multiple sugar transport system substrate-binding protein